MSSFDTDNSFDTASWIGVIVFGCVAVLHIVLHYPRKIPGTSSSLPVFTEYWFGYAFAFFALVTQVIEYTALLKAQGFVNRGDRVISFPLWIGQAVGNSMWLAMFSVIALGGAFYLLINTFSTAIVGVVLIFAALVPLAHFQTWAYVIIAAGMAVFTTMTIVFFDRATRPISILWHASASLVLWAAVILFSVSHEGANLLNTTGTQWAMLIYDLIKTALFLIIYNIFVTWHMLREFRNVVLPFSEAQKLAMQ